MYMKKKGTWKYQGNGPQEDYKAKIWKFTLAPLEDACSENWNVKNEANIYIIRQ